MNEKIKIDIIRVLIVQITFSKILFDFRFVDSIIEMNDNYEDSQFVNFLFKRRNIHNIKTQMRRNVLRFLIFIQTLIRELNEKD